MKGLYLPNTIRKKEEDAMSFKIPLPDTQISFYQRLDKLKKTTLQEALYKTVEKVDIGKLDKELRKYVKNSDLQLLARYGIRGEVMFVVPYLLRTNPQLIGYYRLLLGFPQKSFYTGNRGLGFGIFKSMESKGIITKAQEPLIEDLVKVLNKSSSLLLNSIEKSSISASLIRDLTLLTLGPQLRGGRNNDLGIAATKMVFEIIRQIVSPAIKESTNTKIVLSNAAGRETFIEFASDPDIIIREKLKSGKFKNWIAIEIKGGTDLSNAHNRLGEAEKSHQKARLAHYTECWTLIGFNIDLELASKESPTTDRFYHISHLADINNAEYEDFKESIIAIAGISD
ncbi:XcyI family restriction endonuclease [Desulfoscipio gibsoniae]|uniref:XcyI restriction endonuclease n=1 Tax=Desulfoscipio gibsoniae DSM 7213 TaxID=767817 RepID=R4KFK6_9FIRM|nr:XcyI family restriction endonuclease [Desulfoscipio gibsoniae]AGL00442.1 XcyI restriction endonuclease [Desulfoscipio gibsoniae DSM 7213]